MKVFVGTSSIETGKTRKIRKDTAKIAKKRLQIIIAHQRSELKKNVQPKIILIFHSCVFPSCRVSKILPSYPLQMTVSTPSSLTNP